MGMLLHRHNFEGTDKKASSVVVNNKNVSNDKPEDVPVKETTSEDPVRRGRKRKE